MKKILTVLGLFIVTQSAFAINPDSPYGKSWTRKAVTVCVKGIMSEDIWSFDYVYKLCSCSMRKFISEMSIKELDLYEKDDIDVKNKSDMLIEKFSTECLEELSK